MNGPTIILIALATIFCLKLFGKVALSVPCLIGGGIAAIPVGFAFGFVWLSIAGIVALGAGAYFHETRNWTRYHHASEELERQYPANSEFDLFEEWEIATAAQREFDDRRWK